MMSSFETETKPLIQSYLCEECGVSVSLIKVNDMCFKLLCSCKVIAIHEKKMQTRKKDVLKSKINKMFYEEEIRI
jgi:hypothetical protein